MSANYSLTLVNPDVKTGPTSVVYTNASGGNTLNLVIGNNFGFDMLIGGSSLGEYLVVTISSNILDSDGAAALTVMSPWSIQSYEGTTFNLAPPSGGVTLPNGSSITIELQTLKPSATGTGSIAVSYQFDNTSSDNLNASANVSSLTSPNPNLPPLIGPDQALALTTYVNGGPISNPIMVSASPVTADNAVDNQMHFNLLFQRAAASAPAVTDQSGLVPGWDPLHPPSIRVFFPYFTSGAQLPAPLDLTDALKAGDPHYNALTSAWNIQGSLDPNNSAVTADTFWQIELDPRASVPVWLITPQSANTNLFTNVESSSTEPGPFLNFYLLGIVSALPIDSRNPNTIAYVQWNDFPGFNDGLLALALQKTTLAINSFDVKMKRTVDGPQLIAEWTTTGAGYCQLAGDVTHLDTNAPVDSPYIRAVTTIVPLRTAYTLTAVGTDGVTQVTRTRVARWSRNSAINSVALPSPLDLQATPDGRQLLLLGGPNSGNFGLIILDADTLQPRSLTPFLASGNSILDMTLTPDGSVLFVETLDGYAVYGYDLGTLQPTPGSGATFATPTDAGPVMAVSADGSALVQINGPNMGDGSPAVQMVVLATSNLKPVSPPITIPDGAVAVAVGQQTGRYYIAMASGLAVLDPVTYQAVWPEVALEGTSLIAVSSDESNVYVTTLNPEAQTAQIVRIDGVTGAIATQMRTTIGAVWPLALGGLALSGDNAALFLCGIDLINSTQQKMVAGVKAYDAMTLEELPWSPFSFGDLLPAQIALSPDASRLFVTLSADLNTYMSATVTVIDPEFV